MKPGGFSRWEYFPKFGGVFLLIISSSTKIEVGLNAIEARRRR